MKLVAGLQARSHAAMRIPVVSVLPIPLKTRARTHVFAEGGKLDVQSFLSVQGEVDLGECTGQTGSVTPQSRSLSELQRLSGIGLPACATSEELAIVLLPLEKLA